MERLISTAEIRAAADALVAVQVPWEEAVRLIKRAVLERALELSLGNKSQAARRLKMHRNTFYNQMKETA